MKFKKDKVVIDASVHPVTIRTFVNGNMVDAIVNGGIIEASSIVASDGSGMTVIQNGIWACYYGLNHVFSCKDESSMSHKSNHFDDDNSGANALAIVDIAGDCIAAA